MLKFPVTLGPIITPCARTDEENKKTRKNITRYFNDFI